MAVIYEVCALFAESVKNTLPREPKIVNMIKDFCAVKSANPTTPYGSTDKSGATGGVFNVEVPKIKHAHLTHDISIWYTIAGKDPNIIRLYGVFSHAESGTNYGQPAPKIQQKLAKKMAKQLFNPM